MTHGMFEARIKSVTVLLLGFLAALPAHAEAGPPFPHSTGELLRPAQVAAIALSPSGSHVAYALRVPGSKADDIRVVKIDPPHAVAAVSHFELVAGDDGARVVRLRWVNDAWIVAEIGTDLKRAQQRVGTGSGTFVRTINLARLYSLDAWRGGSGLSLDERLHEGSIVEDPAAVPGMLSVQIQEPGRPALYRLEVATGAITAIEAGDPVTCCWRVRGGRAVVKVNRRPHTGDVAIYDRPAEDPAGWSLARTYQWNDAADLDAATIAEAMGPLQSYVRLRRSDSDTYGIHVHDWAQGEFVATIAERQDVDLDSALVVRHRLLATEFTDDRFRQDFLDPAMRDAYGSLERRFGPDTSIRVLQMSIEGDRWLLRISGPRHPPTYHVLDVSDGDLTKVIGDHPWLDPARLAPASVLRFVTRDNLELTAILTCPAWRGDAPMPLVVMPPPGPAARSALRFDPAAQGLAAQGWCVLEPNYRGVAGQGRRFEELGYGQWSAGIAQDIVDAAQFAADGGIARRDAIAFFARRLGAYAALSAAIRNPELFQACVTRDAAVDLDRVVNELRMTYERFSPIVREWIRNQGDEVRGNSPLVREDELSCPILMLHREGANEVSFAHSESLARKLWPAPFDEILHRLPYDRTWTQEVDNERETVERAIVHLRKYLPHGVDTALPVEPATSVELPPREPSDPPPASASLDNCIQPSVVDREACRGRIRIGIDRAEVEAVLGPPDATTRDRARAQYGDRYLKFDAHGKLMQISDQPQ
jgi:dipeptidyl aminopeptidase/acylaminoacyl peptidase